MKKCLVSLTVILMTLGMLQAEEANAIGCDPCTPEPDDITFSGVKPFDSGCGCNVPLTAKFKRQPNNKIQVDLVWKQCTRIAGQKYTQWQSGGTKPAGDTARNFLTGRSKARTVNMGPGQHSFKVRGKCSNPDAATSFGRKPSFKGFTTISWTVQPPGGASLPPGGGPPVSCSETVGSLTAKIEGTKVRLDFQPGIIPGGTKRWSVKRWRIVIKKGSSTVQTVEINGGGVRPAAMLSKALTSGNHTATVWPICDRGGLGKPRSVSFSTLVPECNSNVKATSMSVSKLGTRRIRVNWGGTTYNSSNFHWRLTFWRLESDKFVAKQLIGAQSNARQADSKTLPAGRYDVHVAPICGNKINNSNVLIRNITLK